MFNTSQDILYIALSLSVLWFTVFLCWLLYQAARVLKNANDIIENVSQKLELIVDAIDFIKEKVEGLSSMMGMVHGILGGAAEKFLSGKLTKKLEEKMADKKTVIRRKEKK